MNQGHRRGKSRRRTLARWLAAGAGLGLLRSGAGQAEAADGDTVRAGQTTDSTTPTRLRTNAATLTPDTTTDGLQGYADGANNAGLFGRNNASNGIGVAGAAPSGTGVFGQSANGYGVGGQSDASHGVYGKSTSGNGTYGETGTGSGVYGKATGTGGTGVTGTTTDAAGTGVYGMSNGGTGSGIGVRGKSGSGPGLRGESTSGMGAYTSSTSGAGAYGETASGAGVHGEATAGGYGVYGRTTSDASRGAVYGKNDGTGAGVRCHGADIGLHASVASGGRAAAIVEGPLEVYGNFTVFGGYAKSGAVKQADGSYRRLYALETPDSWFEDIGSAQLTGGRAQVTLDPEFASLVQAQQYEVFLTPKGDCNGLFVASQSPSGFEVRELKGGQSTLAFSYRIVAKRKDLPGKRLEKLQPSSLPAAVTLPQISSPTTSSPSPTMNTP
ncbi:MAG: hypothetical protein IT305_02180 [Chloroflexi bacterium]|nr:hypothetical protein [Chloroflexota bacterium]